MDKNISQKIRIGRIVECDPVTMRHIKRDLPPAPAFVDSPVVENKPRILTDEEIRK